MSSRRPQFCERRVGPLHQLRHSPAAELSRPPLELADTRPVTPYFQYGGAERQITPAPSKNCRACPTHSQTLCASALCAAGGLDSRNRRSDAEITRKSADADLSTGYHSR